MRWRGAWDTDGGSGEAVKGSGRKEGAEESRGRGRGGSILSRLTPSLFMLTMGEKREPASLGTPLWVEGRFPPAPRFPSVRTPASLLLH